MKSMVCEMCNSNDLIKSEGLYVCQNCGTKYTAEDAKKLLVEVSGKVQIDNSAQITQSLQNGRRAVEKEDWPEADKCYTFVEQNEPQNIEAIFYSSYAKAMDSLTVNDLYKRQAIFKALHNSFDIIVANYDISADNREILTKICKSVFKMYTATYVYTITKNLHGQVTDSNSNDTKKLLTDTINAVAAMLTKMIEKHPQNQRKEIAYIYELRRNVYYDVARLPGEDLLMKGSCFRVAENYSNEWKAVDSTYNDQEFQNDYAEFKAQVLHDDKKGKVGCLIVGGILIALMLVAIIIMANMG